MKNSVGLPSATSREPLFRINGQFVLLTMQVDCMAPTAINEGVFTCGSCNMMGSLGEESLVLFFLLLRLVPGVVATLARFLPKAVEKEVEVADIPMVVVVVALGGSMGTSVSEGRKTACLETPTGVINNFSQEKHRGETDWGNEEARTFSRVLLRILHLKELLLRLQLLLFLLLPLLLLLLLLALLLALLPLHSKSLLLALLSGL